MHGKPYTFRALRKTFGAMSVGCDACRRYAPLGIGGLQVVDYRCSQCGSQAYLAVIEPIKEAGMQDYRLDALERPERHPTAIDRFTGRRRGVAVDHSGGELPGRRSAQQQRADVRPAALGIGPAHYHELLAVEALRLDPDPAL